MPTPERLAVQFEAHRPHVRAVAIALLGSVSEAEDAVQETWIRLSRTDVSCVDNRIDSPFLLPKRGRCLTKSATNVADPRRTRWHGRSARKPARIYCRQFGSGIEEARRRR